MTDLLGLEFIKLFHKQTAHLQKEGPRLLHVDCHSSHINLPLIEFARAHDIVIFGYPPHTTHLLQGLDVVIFSPFKNAYAKHAAEHLKATGQEVEKPVFLSILHKAVQDSFTEKNILLAWKKTGLRPIDPSVISETDLAPSKEFSTAFTLPLPPPSPIRAVVDAIHRQNLLDYPFSRSTFPTLQVQSPPLQIPETCTSSDPQPPTISNTSITSESRHFPSPNLSQTRLPPNFPILHPTTYPDPLSLLTASFDAISLRDHPAKKKQVAEHVSMPVGDNPPQTPCEEDEINVEAVYLAGDILRGLASTRLAPLLELETTTSSCDLPPIERGPLPRELVKAIESSTSPSPELWQAIKTVFPPLVDRMDRLLAQAILQETYCQRIQQVLKLKEKPKAETSMKKIMGLGGGLIFTSDQITAALAEDAAGRLKSKQAADDKRSAKELKKEATQWMEDAEARQKAAHAVLIDFWKSQPAGTKTRRQPPKPALETIPERYKDALKPAKKKPRKRKNAETPPSSEGCDSDDESYD